LKNFAPREKKEEIVVDGALERVEEVGPDAGNGTAVADAGVDGTYRGVNVPSVGG
jgi:hypothetical protein